MRSSLSAAALALMLPVLLTACTKTGALDPQSAHQPNTKPQVIAVDEASTRDASASTRTGEEYVAEEAPRDADSVAAEVGAAAINEGGQAKAVDSLDLSKGTNDPAHAFELGVNVTVLRNHPVGSRLGPVLRSFPSLRGAPLTADPMRDAEWVVAYGPSVIHTDRDAVLVRYNLADSVVDKAIAKSGKTSLGVDNASRAFLRPQSKLLVVVPPAYAKEAAVRFRTQAPRGPSATDALRIVVRHPATQLSSLRLHLPASLNELRFWIVPRNGDGGADLYGEGDCVDDASAIELAAQLTAMLTRMNTPPFRFATRGLLDNAAVVPNGPKATLHISAIAEQLEALLQISAAALNVQVAPPTGP